MSQPLSTAREIAYDAYALVMEKGQMPDDVVDELHAKSGKELTRLDRNFIKEMLYGALRWHAKIYWILQNTSNRNLDETTPQVRAALVMGTYQIFYMDRVPDRAAVNESAEYVRKRGQAQAVSFVNGILRQIARRAEYFAKPDKHLKPVEYLALQFSHPEWIVKRWHEHFKFDRLEKMLSSNNQPPPWYVRINTMKTDLADTHILQQNLLRDERAHTDRRPLRCSLLFKETPHFDENSLFSQGFYTIQDEASQLVGMLVDPQAGETIIDACAGPGGKLTHVYELSAGKAKITALEKNPDQYRRMRETARRLGHEEGIEWIQGDFLDYKPPAPVDRVMLDAPCSGLGVLRRHPEGKWHKRGSLITSMAEQQRKLIEHGLSLLKPGGELIYSVCSFEPEESQAHVAWIKDKLGDRIELVSPIQRLPDYYKRYVTRDNVLMIYAGNQDELDGFGAFILKAK